MSLDHKLRAVWLFINASHGWLFNEWC